MKIDLQYLFYPLALVAIYIAQFDPSLLTADQYSLLYLVVQSLGWFMLAASILGMIAVVFFADSEHVRASVQKTMVQNDTSISEIVFNAWKLPGLAWGAAKLTVIWFFGDMILFTAALIMTLLAQFVFVPALSRMMYRSVG